jgi:hypothetical protein
MRPSLQRGSGLEVVNVVPENRLVGRVDDCGDRLVPAGEAAQNLGLPPSGLVGLAFRRVLGREPVRLPATDVDEPEALADTPRLGQAPGLHRDGGDSPPGRVARVADRRLRDRATHHGPEPVGADEHVARLLAAIGADCRDRVVTLVNCRDLDAEAHVPSSGRELGVKICPVDRDRAL